MSYFDAMKKISNHTIAPLYVLYGSESYFMQNIQQQLRKYVLEDERDAISTYDLEETPIEDIITDAETYPMFSSKKLIIATNATFLTAQRQPASAVDHDVDRLVQYLSQPVDYSVIVLTTKSDTLDNRKKITKNLKKQATVIPCTSIRANELRKWVKQVATDLHVHIDPAAYEVFEREETVQLYQLQNELQKLALYVGDGGTITREIAESLVSASTTSSSLRLVDAVIEKNVKETFMIYQQLMQAKEEPIAIIALLSFQFRTILQVKILKDKGYHQQAIQKKMKAHPFVIQIAYKRERRFSYSYLREAIQILAETDAQIKRGTVEKELALELTLLTLSRMNGKSISHTE